MYWPWQSQLALVLLCILTLAAATTYTLGFSRHRRPFYACRPLLYAVLCSTYNYIVCAVILAQIIVEYSALKEERLTGHPSIHHFPCDVMLATSCSMYFFFAIPSVMMSTTLIVQYYPRYRNTVYRHVLNRHVIGWISAGAAALSAVLFTILKLTVERYRNNEAGLQCSFLAEWWVYWPLGILLIIPAARLTDALREADDVYRIGKQVRAGRNIMSVCSPAYYLMQCILDVLRWTDHIDRQQLEANGLPFDMLALVMHILFAWNTVGRLLMWEADWSLHYMQQVASNPTSPDGRSRRSTLIKAESCWLTELSDDDERDIAPQAGTAQLNVLLNSGRSSVSKPSPAVHQTTAKHRLIVSLSDVGGVWTPQSSEPQQHLSLDHLEQLHSVVPPSAVSTGRSSSGRSLLQQFRRKFSSSVAPLDDTDRARHSTSSMAVFIDSEHVRSSSASVSIDRPTLASQWTCLRVLSDPAMFTAFEAHAQRTLNGENTEFWKECEAYRMLWHAHRQQRAEQKRSGHQLLAPPSAASSPALSKQNGRATIDINNPLNLPIEKVEFCRYMYGKYVKTNAAFQLNISDALRRRYKDAINGSMQPAAGAAQTTTPSSNDKQREQQLLLALLSEVQRECYKLLDTNVWRTFRMSEQFKHLTTDQQFPLVVG